QRAIEEPEAEDEYQERVEQEIGAEQRRRSRALLRPGLGRLDGERGPVRQHLAGRGRAPPLALEAGAPAAAGPLGENALRAGRRWRLAGELDLPAQGLRRQPQERGFVGQR